MSVSLLMEITGQVQPPRVLVVDRPLGFPLGEPHNPELQKQILLAALALLSQPVQQMLVAPFAGAAI